MPQDRLAAAFACPVDANTRRSAGSFEWHSDDTFVIKHLLPQSL
ncbi:hypothetical protein CPter291_4450 [Collimonas pratensis]|uniref:Uncharacterized protein n=1 Tax=Collimonas pratensis TaxID=279113 RepID=A0A127R348_9BURK|nr:hypothetical protein CPter91_4516 [Collimonas pratensis]AMP16676.1 hypothetical protein CPter291_4450 [Collimonas pratensis]